jgi:hypothetical protein
MVIAGFHLLFFYWDFAIADYDEYYAGENQCHTGCESEKKRFDVIAGAEGGYVGHDQIPGINGIGLVV